MNCAIHGHASELPSEVWSHVRADGALHYTRQYWDGFGFGLPCTPYFISFSGDDIGFLPMLRVDDVAYSYFHPTKLLRALLIRAKREDHVGMFQNSKAASGTALVSAVPYAYTSPFRAVPETLIELAIDQFDRFANSHAFAERAFLYFHQTEGDAQQRLTEHGYRVTMLEANAVIPIDPSWASINKYCEVMAHSTQIRREINAFANAHNRFEWKTRLDDVDIEECVNLEQRLLGRKGEHCTFEDLSPFYVSIRDYLPTSFLLLRGLTATGECFGTVIFLIDGTRLIGKAVGMRHPRREFQYFNLAYYEPIRFAASNGFRNIDYGPSAGEAKRIRGAKPEILLGAFRLAEVNPLWRQWETTKAIIESRLKREWLLED